MSKTVKAWGLKSKRGTLKKFADIRELTEAHKTDDEIVVRVSIREIKRKRK